MDNANPPVRAAREVLSNVLPKFEMGLAVARVSADRLPPSGRPTLFSEGAGRCHELFETVISCATEASE